MSRLAHSEVHMVHRIGWLRAAVAGTTLVALAVLGGLGASAGGAGILKGAVRVTFWGALAMAATAGVGMMFGVAA